MFTEDDTQVMDQNVAKFFILHSVPRFWVEKACRKHKNRKRLFLAQQ